MASRVALAPGAAATVFDRAVLVGLGNRAWMIALTIGTVLLIGRFLSPLEQGVYFSLRSLATLQQFFELGLSTALAVFFSHEFTGLRWGAGGSIEGDPRCRERCMAIFARAHWLFFWFAVAFAGLLGAGGFWFFSRLGGTVAWQWPLALTVVMAAIWLYFTPHMALVMGSGEVTTAYQVWFSGSVAGGLVGWLLLVLHHGLYAVAAIYAGNSAAVLFYLLGKRRRLLLGFFWRGSGFSWKRELWPMQWRMGVSTATLSLLFPVLTPILFYYHGPVVAGQIGMTAYACGAVMTVCLVFVGASLPRMSKLAALGRWVELDAYYRGLLAVMVGVALLGALAGGAAAAVLQLAGLPLGGRLLPWPLTLLLLLTVVPLAYVISVATYFRSVKSEPLALPILVSGLAAVVVDCWAGGRFAAAGEVVGFFLVAALVALPLAHFVWLRRRRLACGGLAQV